MPGSKSCVQEVTLFGLDTAKEERLSYPIMVTGMVGLAITRTGLAEFQWCLENGTTIAQLGADRRILAAFTIMAIS